MWYCKTLWINNNFRIEFSLLIDFLYKCEDNGTHSTRHSTCYLVLKIIGIYAHVNWNKTLTVAETDRKTSKDEKL